MPYTLVVHGGAGVVRNTLSPKEEAAAHEGLRQALEAGKQILEQPGGTAVDAVQAAVRAMEDNPFFNAGRGSVLTLEGVAEMDAMVMDGATQRSGAVTGCRRAKNPVVVARELMERGPHRMLAGSAADEWAAARGLQMEPAEYFITPLRRQQQEQSKGDLWLDHHRLPPAAPAAAATTPPAPKTGTVGAVAVDSAGNLAAATSTGGLTNKLPGRVGDSPLIGCGTWADNSTCAISATGAGETIMRIALAHRIAHTLELLPDSTTLASACDEGISKLSATKGIGGVIAVNAQGHVAMPFNTDGMYRGAVSTFEGAAPLFTAIY